MIHYLCSRFMKTQLQILILIFVSLFAGPVEMSSQLVPLKNQQVFVDSLKRELDFGPYFGLYKDNYFTVGTSLFHVPTSKNSDVKFQISLAIRLTDAVLPWHSFLFLMYTQKTFWNVFEESLPIVDINFNPGIGWAKPFFNDNRYVGKLTFLLEHESNGRDGPESRSWNRVALAGSSIIDEWLMVHAKIWVPIIDSGNNKDIVKYCGFYKSGVVVTTPNKNFSFGLTLVKRGGWNLSFNTILELTWRVHKKTNLNLFAQYYNGYGESLINYNKFTSMLRVGLVFKPKFFSDF